MKPPRVFAVTDDRVVAKHDFFERARGIAQDSRIAIVLRARLPGGQLLGVAQQLREITETSGTRLIIHDRLDVARLSRADAGHLPAHGIAVRDACQYLGTDVRVGRSVHTPEEAGAAVAEGAWYVFLGSIWETPSHAQRPPLGELAMMQARVLGADLNLIVIGGVTPERARRAREQGATGVAAIRAIWDAPDPALATKELLLSLE